MNTITRYGSLTEGQQKFCRCVLKVASKQSDECLKEKAWFQYKSGTKCYNPYSVCAHSVKTSTKHCYYDFKDLSDQLIRTWFILHDKAVPSPFIRENAILIMESYFA